MASIRTAFLFLLMTGALHAGSIGTPTFTPASPQPFQPVTMHIMSGVCAFFMDTPDSVDVSVSGAIIEVVIDGGNVEPQEFSQSSPRS